MDMNEKEKRLIEFAKVLGVTLEARGESKEYKDKKGNLVVNPVVTHLTYRVVIKDD